MVGIKWSLSPFQMLNQCNFLSCWIWFLIKNGYISYIYYHPAIQCKPAHNLMLSFIYFEKKKLHAIWDQQNIALFSAQWPGANRNIFLSCRIAFCDNRESILIRTCWIKPWRIMSTIISTYAINGTTRARTTSKNVIRKNVIYHI